MLKETVVFDKPVMVAGKPLEKVVMATPTIGVEEDAMDLAISLGRAKNPLTSEMCMFSKLTGIPYDALRTLPSYEMEKLRRAYDYVNAPLTAPVPETPGTPAGNCETSGQAS